MTQNKTIPILLTIIAVLFVSLLVVLTINLSKNQTTPVKIDVALTPTTEPTLVPTKPTSTIPSDWKTFTDSSSSYSIQYPNNWYAAEFHGTVFINNSPLPEDEGYLTHGVPTGLQINTDSFGLTSYKSSTETTVSKITSNGIDGVKIVRHTPEQMDGNYQTFVIFNKNGLNYNMLYNNSDTKGTHNPVFDQIISTFKFTK